MPSEATVLLLAPGAEAIRPLLDPLPAGVRLVPVASLSEARPLASSAEAMIALPFLLDRAFLDEATALQWIQTITSGIDALLPLGLSPHIAVSTTRGTQGPQMAELVFFYMLSLLRDVRGVLNRQKAGVWQPTPQPTLLRRRMVIVGVGAIAEAVAARCQAFGMHVTGLSASRTSAPGFDEVRPMAALVETAAEADVLLVLTPYSKATHHLIDGHVLAALPGSAILINIARGKVVDEAALIEALAERRIAGAGLDVFETEPLPGDSPLRALDTVLLTPHVGGLSTTFAQQIAPVIVDNLHRWFGRPRRPLVNQVKPMGE